LTRPSAGRKRHVPPAPAGLRRSARSPRPQQRFEGAEHAVDGRGGAAEPGERLGFSRVAERRPQQRHEDPALGSRGFASRADRSGHGHRAVAAGPSGAAFAVLPGAGPPRAGGRSLATGTGALMWVPHLVIHGVPSARRLGGPGEGDGLGVLPARSPARASALARTTSGSRGSAGRASCQRCSRRALGRGYGSAALCLISSAGHPISWGPVAGSPAPVARLFGKRYGFSPAQGVTRRCLPGGISRRGDLSPEGVTWPAGVRCQGMRPSCRARAAASVRLAGPIMCAHRSR
jgi:hypothetical protein